MERSILSPNQQKILTKISQSQELTSRFYFSGGTALSEVYLKHRLSEDLDFFSDHTFAPNLILKHLNEWAKDLSFTFTSQFVDPTHIYLLQFAPNRELKIDFAYYPYSHLEPIKRDYKVPVDSLMDIAVNKLVTLSQRHEVKDFVDLYFLLRSFSLWDLISGARIKFHLEIEPLTLAADFTGVENFTYLPTLLSPVSLTELKSYFLTQAQTLGKKMVK